MDTQDQEILSIDGCIAYVRENYGKLYPVIPNQRKHTFGNIPEGLHKQITMFANARNLTIAETIASMWDFLTEYESEFAEMLEAQRNAPKKRRG